MNKNDLKELFYEYQWTLKEWENNYTKNHIDLLEKFDDNYAFMRNCFDDGHFTASTFVVNKDFSKILLMHHIKFDRWQQFWWHADGEIDLLNEAKRELHEESWAPHNEIFIFDDILELDIHDVQHKWWEQKHKHYDVRFLAIIDENTILSKADDEAHAVAWFDFEDVISSDDTKFQSSMKKALLKIKLLHKK